jgi:hypothetical protein
MAGTLDMRNGLLDLGHEEATSLRDSEVIAAAAKYTRPEFAFQAVDAPNHYRRIDAKDSGCLVEISRLSSEDNKLLGFERDVNHQIRAHSVTFLQGISVEEGRGCPRSSCRL